jgi:hypothetical protein
MGKSQMDKEYPEDHVEILDEIHKQTKLGNYAIALELIEKILRQSLDQGNLL